MCRVDRELLGLTAILHCDDKASTTLLLHDTGPSVESWVWHAAVYRGVYIDHDLLTLLELLQVLGDRTTTPAFLGQLFPRLSPHSFRLLRHSNHSQYVFNKNNYK